MNDRTAPATLNPLLDFSDLPRFDAISPAAVGPAMDLLLRGFSLRFLWSMELFAVLVAMLAITTLVDSTWQNFLRAYQLGDSTIDIKLPVWPTKLLVPFVLAVLWVRLALQAADYARLIRHPNAQPIAVPVIETIEVQAQNEIQEALGREEKTTGEKRP